MTRPRDNLTKAGLLAGLLPGLLLEAEKVAQSFMRGIHGRRRVGTGEAFWQFRPFQAGDAGRDIDWRQTAKRDEIFVRQTEWEASQSIWLYRDASASMYYHAKKDYAEILLLALGMVLLSGGEQVSLLGTDLSPQTGYAAAQRLFETLPAQTHLIDSAKPIAARSQVIIISDFFFSVEELASFCERLAARQIKGVLVQLFHENEETLPYKGRIKFEDPEDPHHEALTLAQVEAVRAEYTEKFTGHQQKIAALAKGLGWAFEKIRTDEKPESVLARLYDVLAVKK